MLYFPLCQQQFARKSENPTVYFYFCPSTLCLQARKAKGGEHMKERNNQNKNQNQENTTIPLLEKQLREVNKKLDNLMKAIEDGLYTRTTKERLEELEIQKDELIAKIADEKLKKPSFNEDFIRFWLMKFRKFDISQKKQRKALIGIFVNAIFLYDDRMLITFNYKDGTQTVRFEDALTADCGEKSLRLRSNESPSGAFLFAHSVVRK